MVKSLYINHLSWGHDREKGGECHWNKCVPYCKSFSIWQVNPSLLNYDDVIMLHH